MTTDSIGGLGEHPGLGAQGFGESSEQRLRILLSASKESAPADYASIESVSTGDLTSLEQDLRLKLVAGGHTANIEESTEATLLKGGGVGESLEQILLATGRLGLT
jgi:hypothetical protein